MVELALTQAELAAACDLDVRTTQRWLAGQRVSFVDAERVAIALGVGTADLFVGVPQDVEQPIPDSVRSVLRKERTAGVPLAMELPDILEAIGSFDARFAFRRLQGLY